MYKQRTHRADLDRRTDRAGLDRTANRQADHAWKQRHCNAPPESRNVIFAYAARYVLCKSA